MNGAHLMQGKDVRKVERRENKSVGRLLKSQKTAENNNVPKKMTENWAMEEALCQHLQVLIIREKWKRGIDRLLRAVRDDPSTPAEAPVNQPAPKVLEDKRQIEASKENSDKCGQRTRADNDDRVNKLIKRAVVTSVPVNTSVTSTFSPFTSENGSNVSVTNNDRRFRDLRQNSGLDCGDSSESQDSGNTTTIALTVTVTTHPSVSSVSDHVPETTTYQATPSISNNAPQLTTQRAFFVISGVKTESGTPVTPKIEDSLIPQNSQNRTS
ncbi:hypothetical protein Q1695_002891 [Nippostrongylus brasiliensis]|nr:hypothetical protein Q1695_002891 [Nippostrongylus brasiliensis]